MGFKILEKVWQYYIPFRKYRYLNLRAYFRNNTLIETHAYVFECRCTTITFRLNLDQILKGQQTAYSQPSVDSIHSPHNTTP